MCFSLRMPLVIAALLAVAIPAHAEMISEFEPNPAGGDPPTTTYELSGMAGSAFDLWILSIENDGINGTVDRAANVTGSFDSNGLAVVTTPDLENPSFTVILTDAFTGSIGDDLDPADSGVLDTTSLGTILDAVGVSDAPGDDGTLYASGLGGTDILFNGEFEPLLVFRDASTGDFYQTVTVDFGTPGQFVGVFDAAANAVSAAAFDSDPTTGPTYGAINPSLSAIPEPGSVVLVLLGASFASMIGLRSRWS